MSCADKLEQGRAGDVELFRPDEEPEMAVTLSLRSKGVEMIIGDHVGEAQEQTGFWTSQMKALGLTAFLFLLITAVQAVGAVAAHSQVLLVDCISMGIDGVTYILNMGVETQKGTKRHDPAELVVGAISIGLLAYFTVDALKGSLDTVRFCRGELSEDPNGGEGVNPWIVLAFAVGGLVFDAISLYAFRRSHKETQSGKTMNMWTALMHVGADFMRSATTFVMSLLIIVGGMDSTCLDATCSLLVGGTILAGALAGSVAWCQKLFTTLAK